MPSSRLDLGEQTPRGEWTDLLGQLSPVALDGGVLHVTLPPECAAWLRAPVTHG